MSVIPFPQIIGKLVIFPEISDDLPSYSKEDSPWTVVVTNDQTTIYSFNSDWWVLCLAFLEKMYVI